MKVDEPEKTTGPSGVIPIAVLKKESTIVDTTSLYIAFIIRNLILHIHSITLRITDIKFLYFSD